MTPANAIQLARSNDCIEVTVQGTEAYSFTGISPEVTVAEQRALWSVPFILSGQPAPIVRYFTSESARTVGALITTVADGVTYIGRTTERFGLNLDQYDPHDPLSAGPGPIDLSTIASISLEGFVAVKPLDLVDAIVQWAERLSDVTQIRSKPIPEADRSRCDSLLADAITMRDHYATHGSLDGFELERSRAEVESVLYECTNPGGSYYVRDARPRTVEYARKHGLVSELVNRLLEDSDADVSDRLRTATNPDDGVSVEILSTLEDTGDERMVPLCRRILDSDHMPKRRAAARLLAGMSNVDSSKQVLDEYVEDEDPEIRRITSEALSKKDE